MFKKIQYLLIICILSLFIFGCLSFQADELNTVTFIACGDLHIQRKSQTHIKDFLKAIYALKQEPLVWQKNHFASGNILAPQSIIIAGDLTETNLLGINKGRVSLKYYNSIKSMIKKKHNINVYEIWGNHDYPPVSSNIFSVKDYITKINPYRYGISNYSKNGHYSWENKFIHFIHLNLKASNTIQKNQKNRNPYNALTYLKNDLQMNTRTTNKKVIIVQHYGFMGSNYDGDEWWTDQELEILKKILYPFKNNIIAIIHGHYHNTFSYTREGYRIYNAGSPLHNNLNEKKYYSGRFLYFQISKKYMDVQDIFYGKNYKYSNPKWGPNYKSLGSVQIY